jgi:periplasmic copper chaperone A
MPRMRITAAYLLMILTLQALPATAAAPAVTFTDAWMRATPGTEVAAVYLSVRNTGTQALDIVGVHSPRAAAAMIHETRQVGAQSTMRPHEQVHLAAGQTVQFAPAGLHIMLMNLTRPLVAGEQLPLIFEFADGTSVTVRVRVRALGDE